MKLMITCIFFFTISCVAHAQPKMIIGIAGGSGSGKTTLAHKILDAFPQQATLISQDSYYKGLEGMSEEQKAMANFDHPQALDFDLLKQHLIALKQGDDIDQPVYDFFTHTRKHHTTRVHSQDLIIVEGILLFAVPEIYSLFDLTCFVDTDDDIRLLRRMERDIHERGRSFESIKKQYLHTVKPMHMRFVEPSKKNAHIIIPFGKENEIAISLLISKVREALEH
jgi:uridine kinase